MSQPDFRLVVDGELIEVHLASITAEIAREYRAATGLNIMTVLGDPGPDSAAVLVWISRRLKGARARYLDVEKTVNLGNVEPAPDEPEAEVSPRDEDAAVRAVAADPEGPDASS